MFVKVPILPPPAPDRDSDSDCNYFSDEEEPVTYLPECHEESDCESQTSDEESEPRQNESDLQNATVSPFCS